MQDIKSRLRELENEAQQRLNTLRQETEDIYELFPALRPQRKAVAIARKPYIRRSPHWAQMPENRARVNATVAKMQAGAKAWREGKKPREEEGNGTTTVETQAG